MNTKQKNLYKCLSISTNKKTNMITRTNKKNSTSAKQYKTCQLLYKNIHTRNLFINKISIKTEQN